MTKPKLHETKIPFHGFYESCHSSNIDHAIERCFDIDGDGNNHIPEGFYWSFNHNNDIQIEYCKLYLDGFQDFFNSETGLNVKFNFNEMTSPKEYNFQTDRLFAGISMKDIKAIWRKTNREVLTKNIADSFTSYDGFFSSYSNDLLEWIKKPLKTWDHNELCCLIEACLITNADKNHLENMQYEVMENALCNGGVDNIVYPYLEKWSLANPTECHAEAVQAKFDITDDAWKEMSEDAKTAMIEKWKYLQPCELTADLLDKHV